MPQTAPFVFLSHSGADTEAARELKRRLENAPDARAAGLKVWFDKHEPQARRAMAAADRTGDREPGDRLCRLCRLERRDELGRCGGRRRIVAREHEQVAFSSFRRSPPTAAGRAPCRHSPSSIRASAIRSAMAKNSESCSRRSSNRIGTSRQDHRRAVRRPALDAGRRGRPVLRPRGGGRGARRKIPHASLGRDRRRQRHGQVFARRGRLRPGLPRRRARRLSREPTRRPRLARRHDAAGANPEEGLRTGVTKRRKSLAVRPATRQACENA